MPFLAVSSTWKYAICIYVTKSHTINEYQYLKILRTSRNFRFEMHQASCRDAVLHYNYELGYSLWGEESIKAKQKRAASPSLLPNQHTRISEKRDKTNPKQHSLRFSEESQLRGRGVWKHFTLKEKKKTFGEWSQNIYKPSPLLN